MIARRGFTLLEFLVAVGIGVLISGVTVVYLRRAEPGRVLEASSRALVTDLRLALQLAVASQIIHEVRFDTVGKRYAIMALETPEVTVKEINLNPHVSFGNITLPGQIAQFNALGAVTASGNIVLQHQDGNVRTILISPSGYVQTQ